MTAKLRVLAALKSCRYCGEEFARSERMSWSYWERREFCTRACSTAHRRELAAETLPARLLANIDFTQGECWIWTGSRNNHGYGRTSLNKKVTYAHRATYELLVGPIPDGCELDHLCRIHVCCNPAHLEAVTHRENNRRAFDPGVKTHCPNGHPWTAENTMERGDGSRRCRECNRERCKRRYYEQRAVAA